MTHRGAFGRVVGDYDERDNPPALLVDKHEVVMVWKR
jgi:hypothetical protein